MEYLSDNSSVIRSFTSCDSAVHNRRTQEESKPLTETQRKEYRVLFENYLVSKQSPNEHLIKLLRLKFSMTMEEWFIWLKMEQLCYCEKNIQSWFALMDKCIQEVKEANGQGSRNCS